MYESMARAERFTERQVELVEEELRLGSYLNTKLYKFLDAANCIKPLPMGLEELVVTKFEKLEVGQISTTVENFPEISPHLTEATRNIFLIGAKLKIGHREVLKWRNNTSGIGKRKGLIERTMGEFRMTLYKQIEQFCAWGTEMREPSSLDKYKGTTEIAGLINGGYQIKGGTGGDDNMAAEGDFDSTVDTAFETAASKGFDWDYLWIFSDLNTKKQARRGAHRYSTYGGTEQDVVINRADVKKWVSSYNFLDYTEAKYTMLLTNPEATKTPRSRSKRTKPYTLYQEPISVFPMWDGGINEKGQFGFLVYWAATWDIQEPYAAIWTGAEEGTLVFT